MLQESWGKNLGEGWGTQGETGRRKKREEEKDKDDAGSRHTKSELPTFPKSSEMQSVTDMPLPEFLSLFEKMKDIFQIKV